MASSLDAFPYLPGIIHELQDGNLQITESSSVPSVLILGTAARGPADIKTFVNRANETEGLFGSEGTLIRGMWEAIAAGGENISVMRIGATSATLYGVGTDNQMVNPTSIVTVMSDGSAGDMYFIRYMTPADISPTAAFGHLIVKNLNGLVVYDGNPGGVPYNNGEVVVSGVFDGGVTIGDPLDPDDFVSMTTAANTGATFTEEFAVKYANHPMTNMIVGGVTLTPSALYNETGLATWVDPALPQNFNLAFPRVIGPSMQVLVGGLNIATPSYGTLVAGGGLAGNDKLTIFARPGSPTPTPYVETAVPTWVATGISQDFDLANPNVVGASLVVTVGGVPVLPANYTLTVGGGLAGNDGLTINDSVPIAEVTTVTCYDASSIPASAYLTFSDSPTTTVGFWFTVDGAGTVPLSGADRFVEVALVTGDTPSMVASKLATVIDGQPQFTAPPAALSTVTVTHVATGVMPDALAGSTGFGLVITKQGAPGSYAAGAAVAISYNYTILTGGFTAGDVVGIGYSHQVFTPATYTLPHKDVTGVTVVKVNSTLLSPASYSFSLDPVTGVGTITLTSIEATPYAAMYTLYANYAFDLVDFTATYDLAENMTSNHVVKVLDGTDEIATLNMVTGDYAVVPGAGTVKDKIRLNTTGTTTGTVKMGNTISIEYLTDPGTEEATTRVNAYGVTLDAGDDGLSMSKMKMYEVLDQAYTSLESSEIDIIVPKAVYLDDKNVADGSVIILPGANTYPEAGSSSDVLGYLYKEEYLGEMYYWWRTDPTAASATAQIWPSEGMASPTTKIDGTELLTLDFVEVNFAYQLANFAFSLSVNDNECTAVISALGPKSYTQRDLSLWIGKEPVVDALGKVVVNGSGLLGNKWMAGTTTRQKGFYATYSGNLPTGADFSLNGDIIKDRNAYMIDIGKYLSVCAFDITFFNSTDTTGLGYQAGMESYYAGFYSMLAPQSSPLNKVLTGVTSFYRLSKTKLNSMAKMHYVTVKVKEGELRIADASTAATDKSDYHRLTTIRIVADVVDAARGVVQPYIGEPNTAPIRAAMETGVIRELTLKQEVGVIQSFQVKITSTTAQQIQGDATMELIIVPAFELRKVTIITSIGA